MRRVLILVVLNVLYVSLPFISSAAGNKAPELVSFEYDDLLKIRESIRSGKGIYLESYNKLLASADQLLGKIPQKVTDGDLPPTGDAHDFFAIGKFSWPNPATANGMPYVRRDGAHNKEAFGDRYDLTRFQKTVNDINILSLAWFYTQDEKYAGKAKDLLNVWFVDTATRMNPNMNCASSLPGVYNGMSVGIIFSVILIEMVDHVKLLGLSKSWDTVSDEKLKKWFADYLDWLNNSELGKQERAATNNHGTWYAAQAAAYYIYTGEKDKARALFTLSKAQVAEQVKKDGSMPRELKRVEAFHYFIYGLKAFVVLSRSMAILGEDLSAYRTEDGRGLHLSFEFIIPYILGDKKWNYGGTVNLNEKGLFPAMLWGYSRYQSPGMLKVLHHLTPAFTTSAGIDKLYVYRNAE